MVCLSNGMTEQDRESAQVAAWFLSWMRMINGMFGQDRKTAQAASWFLEVELWV